MGVNCVWDSIQATILLGKRKVSYIWFFSLMANTAYVCGVVGIVVASVNLATVGVCT